MVDTDDCAGGESLRYRSRDSLAPQRAAKRNYAGDTFESIHVLADHPGPLVQQPA
jgi:hypothetical protein